MLLTETGKESPYVRAVQDARLASSRPESNWAGLSSEAQMLKTHLDRIDRESLIRQNVSQQAVSAWDQLARQALGVPEIGYSLAPNLYAELAWPVHTPPVAILTGRHSADAARWRNAGWDIH
jgi:hypothetical protein